MLLREPRNEVSLNLEISLFRIAIERAGMERMRSGRLQNARKTSTSGKRHHLSARLSWQQSCDLVFAETSERWERPLGAPGFDIVGYSKLSVN